MDATSRLVGVVVLLGGLSVVMIFHSGVLRSLRRFFTEPGSAYDLAFFRLLFFPLALRSTDVRLGSAEHLARLPRFMLIHARGMGWAIHYLPISPRLVSIAFTVASITGVTAALGVRTRLSSGVFVIAAGYYLTVGYMFGTGGHFQAVLWVAAIMTVSRSGDVLSFDAALAARRNARQGESVEAPAPHVRYALPLRMIWLLLGSIYFFPGLFKYLHAGLGWASPANIRAEIYWKMPLYPGWTPPFNLWHYDGLLRTAGLGTMLFELSFLFLIISPRTRPIAAFSGLVFHNVTNLLMRIPFWSLQLVYVSFIPWTRLSDRIWRRRGRLVFVDSGDSMRTRPAMAVVRVLALPGAIQAAVGLPDSSGRITNGVADKVRVLHGNDSYVGFDAYRRVAWRVPFAWSILPLLYLPPIASLGRRWYARTTPTPEPSATSRPTQIPEQLPARHRGVVSVALVGSLLLGGMVYSAVTDNTSGWPMSIYPTFEGKATRVTPVALTQIVTTNRNGTVQKVDLARQVGWVSTVRRAGLLARFGNQIKSGSHKEQAVCALWQVLDDGNGRMQNVTRVDIYHVIVPADPSETPGWPYRRWLVSASLPTARATRCTK